VRICYEGAVYEQSEMRTLADRAVYACGRMVDGYPTSAAMSVPRESLVAVGTLDPTTSEVVLTDDQSAAAVAEWLETPRLDPSELQPGLEHPLTVRRLADADLHLVVTGGLALALIRRSVLHREEREWAVVWALLQLATGAKIDGNKRLRRRLADFRSIRHLRDSLAWTGADPAQGYTSLAY
jgi:hypothetical protein